MTEQRKPGDTEAFAEWRDFLKAACHPLSPALYTLKQQTEVDLYNICDHKWRMFEDVGPRCVKCHRYKLEGWSRHTTK